MSYLRVFAPSDSRARSAFTYGLMPVVLSAFFDRHPKVKRRAQFEWPGLLLDFPYFEKCIVLLYWLKF
jgi:hypothetical protein